MTCTVWEPSAGMPPASGSTLMSARPLLWFSWGTISNLLGSLEALVSVRLRV